MATVTDTARNVLTRAIDQVEGALADVSPDRLEDPTPCRDWTVGQLVAHLVVDPRNFVAMANDEQIDWAAAPELPEDWTAAFRANADELLQMWSEAGDGAEAGSMDWQTAEFAVHTWDLARALGRDVDLDPEVAERGLAFMGVMLTQENRGEAFGPPVEVADDAPLYDRLAAVAGRDPGLAHLVSDD
jgi:uncharacterized protein (TIGR03086 family)